MFHYSSGNWNTIWFKCSSFLHAAGTYFISQHVTEAVLLTLKIYILSGLKMKNGMIREHCLFLNSELKTEQFLCRNRQNKPFKTETLIFKFS